MTASTCKSRRWGLKVLFIEAYAVQKITFIYGGSRLAGTANSPPAPLQISLFGIHLILIPEMTNLAVAMMEEEP